MEAWQPTCLLIASEMPTDDITKRYKKPQRLRWNQTSIQPATKESKCLKPLQPSTPSPIKAHTHHYSLFQTQSPPLNAFKPSSKSPPHSISPPHPHVPKTPPAPIHPSHPAPPAPHSSTSPAWPPCPAHTPSSSASARARPARWAPPSSRSRAPTRCGSCSPSCAWDRPAAATRRKGSDSRVRRRGACRRGWWSRRGRWWCWRWWRRGCRDIFWSGFVGWWLRANLSSGIRARAGEVWWDRRGSWNFAHSRGCRRGCLFGGAAMRSRRVGGRRPRRRIQDRRREPRDRFFQPLATWEGRSWCRAGQGRPVRGLWDHGAGPVVVSLCREVECKMEFGLLWKRKYARASSFESLQARCMVLVFDSLDHLDQPLRGCISIAWSRRWSEWVLFAQGILPRSSFAVSVGSDSGYRCPGPARGNGLDSSSYRRARPRCSCSPERHWRDLVCTTSRGHSLGCWICLRPGSWRWLHWNSAGWCIVSRLQRCAAHMFGPDAEIAWQRLQRSRDPIFRRRASGPLHRPSWRIWSSRCRPIRRSCSCQDCSSSQPITQVQLQWQFQFQRRLWRPRFSTCQSPWC